MITTVGESHGEVDGRMILADSNPLIKSASFSRNFGATGRTLCAIGLPTPTSISQIAPRAAGGRPLHFLWVDGDSSRSIVVVSSDRLLVGLLGRRLECIQ